jgi:hypothetical protein
MRMIPLFYKQGKGEIIEINLPATPFFKGVG